MDKGEALLGVTKQTIINYEKGTTEPSWERLEDIAKALKIDVDELFPYSELGEKKGDLKWAEHLERLANNFQYARMAEEELLLQSLFDYSKFQREVEQKNYTKEQLNQALELESSNTMSDEDKIDLITLKYEKVHIDDKDIEYLHNTLERVISLLSSFISVEDGKEDSMKQLVALLNKDTLKTMQLLGFNYKEAIGEPLTEVCSNAIRNKLGGLSSKKNVRNKK